MYYVENFKEWTNTQKQTFDSVTNDEPRIIIPLRYNGKIIGYQGRASSSKIEDQVHNDHAWRMYRRFLVLTKSKLRIQYMSSKDPSTVISLEMLITCVGAMLTCGLLLIISSYSSTTTNQETRRLLRRLQEHRARL